MTAALALIDLAGYVALLLWGVRMVQTGFERALGADLRRVLELALGNPAKAFAAGLGVTALLQSSTATGLMVSAFAGAGMIELVPALAAMLGANVGTTLIVQVLTFDIMPIVPVLFLAGIVMFRRSGSKRIHDFGRVAIGLGLILLSLDRLVATIRPFESAPEVEHVVTLIAAVPLLAFLAGAVVTWAAHSSVAIVLLVGSFVSADLVPFEAGVAMVIGANLGTAINPVLETPGGRDPAARRVPVGNLLNRLVACAVALAVLPYVADLFEGIEVDSDRRVADFHTAFNVAAALMFFPLLGPMAALLRRLLPARVEPPDEAQPRFLDAALLASTGLAAEAAGREGDRVAGALAVLVGALPGLMAGDAAARGVVRARCKQVEALSDAVRAYLDKASSAEAADRERRRLGAAMAFVGNLDHAAETAGEVLPGHIGRHPRARAALVADPDIAEGVRRLAAVAAGFAEGARGGAEEIAAIEAAMRAAVDRASARHLAAIAAGDVEAGEASEVVVDVLQELKRVARYMAAAVGAADEGPPDAG